MNFVEFLHKWQAYMILHPEQRKGQAMLNLLYTLNLHDVYKVVDDQFGIFYSDDNLNEAIGYLSTIFN